MKKGLILLGALLESGGIVFVVLFTTSRVNYSGASSKIDEILTSRDTVADVLNTEVSDYSKFDAQKLQDYASTVRATKEKVDALRANKACSVEKFKERCDELGEIYDKLVLSADSTDIIIKFVTESSDIAGVSTNTLNEMADSSNMYLQTMAKDLLDYKKAVDDFKSKYVANADDTDFVVDYSEIDKKYQALKSKYSEIESEQLFGASDEELLSFYDKIEELKKLFAEEK